MKTYVITGASSGLGKSFLNVLKDQPINLVLTARNTETLRQYLESLGSLRAKIWIEQVELTDDQSIIKFVSKVSQRFGSLNVLINNAGVGMFQSLLEINMNEIDSIFETNVIGLIKLTKQLLPLLEQNGGDIINIGSMAGKLATSKTSVYAASKFAVQGFSNALRLEEAHTGVRVHVINPGPMKTNFFEHADPSKQYLKNVGKILLDPNQVAIKSLKMIGTKRREINLPWYMGVGSKLYSFFPRLGDRLLNSKLINRK
ncbi:SDR family NAD(P)-dependent oxidoreductase [Pediococcus claussenii]|uniref:Short chain dehydrogenase family protein n=1 Tax=Pediococcus claussenii (strain ATCC BAA-344 / DSM 14800 / JCM 18046 / KCTC 3811 / LMG 21948 / P06) TaxID=701521 RepID=G8PD02_PEDCP|nr:SDR family oxidoreductase [Pediococcus claussenii]AEV95137.1 short chain dehydrogenase family protein [Pediococcus claussenii ATCC BAA-344]ANZ70321.1 hypothetical protein AYR57_08325 [Pediococcus claussenii]ANZ72137.1 hypothetical protein AYR58_08325 [Pediococcus claussenii]KRN18894.1 hypothetical protein IV79_GL000322 [Pediococcus claussenii]